MALLAPQPVSAQAQWKGTIVKESDGTVVRNPKEPIYKRDGRLLARMPLKPRGSKISGGKYYALDEDEDGYQYVKRYAVTWKVK